MVMLHPLPLCPSAGPPKFYLDPLFPSQFPTPLLTSQKSPFNPAATSPLPSNLRFAASLIARLPSRTHPQPSFSSPKRHSCWPHPQQRPTCLPYQLQPHIKPKHLQTNPPSCLPFPSTTQCSHPPKHTVSNPSTSKTSRHSTMTSHLATTTNQENTMQTSASKRIPSQRQNHWMFHSTTGNVPVCSKPSWIDLSGKMSWSIPMIMA